MSEARDVLYLHIEAERHKQEGLYEGWKAHEWADELYEALDYCFDVHRHPQELSTALVRVAAVAVAWAEEVAKRAET